VVLAAFASYASYASYALFAMLTVSAPAAAQERDSTVAVVQRLVNAGDRAGARQYADSVLGTAREGTERYAEALFARAFASSSAVEAERDYLRVVIEYGLSPRAEDATMMVAQLKLARSDRAGARRNFERLVREHPMGTQVAKAAFWAGRLAVEDGELVRGCQSLEVAKQRARSDDLEFTNQVDYYLQRCTASALAASAAPQPPSATPPPAKEPPPAATRDRPVPARPGTRTTPREAPPTPPRAARDSTAVVSAPRDTTVGAATPRDTSPPAPPAPPVTLRGADSIPPGAPPAAPPATPPAAPLKEYSVQVAAFPKRRDADALAQVLSQRGFTARVWGGAPPFRVRVGRYASREEAEAQRARLKAARINGMVVDAEPL
jgi:SPOR domain